MWRSIASRSHLTRNFNLGRKLLSFQNPSSSHSQVLNEILISSSKSSQFSQPRNFPHQNLRFFSHSPINSEFETEANDASVSSSSSSEELETGESGRVFDETHDASSSQEVGLTSGFDGVDENNEAQMGSFGSNDQDLEGVNEGSVVEFDVEKLENVLSLLQSTIDESFESSLDGIDMVLNEEFVLRVLETPLVPREHLIRFVKWALSKDEFAVTTSVLGALARVICNEPERDGAFALWDLVKEIAEKEKGDVNSETLNQLISALSELGEGEAAFEVFSKFEELGCVPNEDTYYLTIEALCKGSFYDLASSVCQRMLDDGMIPQNEKVGNIITFFCKGRREKEAHIVYLEAKEKSKHPPQEAVDFLISCLSKEGETVHLAQKMLVDFPAEVRMQSIYPFSCVIRGLCKKKDTEDAKKLLFEMIEKGPPPTNAVFNPIINSLSKAGDLEDAKEIMRVMESKGLKPDVFTYSVIMSGYAKGGAMEEACKVLSEAKKVHSKLCPATYHTLIRGYCKLGEFDKALALLSEMKDYGVEATVDEYNKLIQSLCLMALDWKTAEKLLEEMNEKGLRLPSITRGLISAVKELDQEAVVSEEAVAKA